jgi:hypothetical protein
VYVALVAPEIKVAPDVEADELLYHWYVGVFPILATAEETRVVDVLFKQSV